MKIIHGLAGATLALALISTSWAPSWAQSPVERRERGQLILENVPETPPMVRERLNQYVNTRAASFQGFAPDGGILITTRFADAAQVHRVSAPLGAREQLTFYREPVAAARPRPQSSAWGFLKDAGGDEFYQGFLFDPASGRAASFTEAGTRNLDFVWSRDGAKAAWSRATADDPNQDILVGDPGKPGAQRVALEGTGAMSPLDFSPDGERLLVRQYISIAKSKLFVLDLTSGALQEITPRLNVAYQGGAFLPDGRSILAASDERSEFLRLVRIDLATGKRTVLTPAPEGDVENFEIAPDGQIVAIARNLAGASKLDLLDLRDGTYLDLPDLPAGVVRSLSWSADGGRLGFSFARAAAPSDVWVYELKDNRFVQWTQSETGGLDRAAFAEPSLARYPTFDSKRGGPKEITSWVYRPKGKPRGVIVSIHGGPEAQTRPEFSSTVQYWVNELNLAVVLPNVRGSSGFGKTFVGLDNGLKRLDSVRDIGATLDWIDAQEDLKGLPRIAYGGSYGGYMVYAAMIMFPERWSAGVDIVGIADFKSFLETTKGYRRDLRRVEYGDERDPKIARFFAEIAPVNNAAKINRPMFIIHGQNDPRVPVSEAEQMIKAFRAKGLETWVMIAKDEGHGFQKKQNQEAQREAETLFFDKVLGARPAA
jgi:dipeptidyl aminopeptidase/acylaminoacyl peptidase